MRRFNVKEIVITDPKKSSLDMGSSIKGTGKIGRLIPVFSQELLPNSTINYVPNTLTRFVPLAVPLMNNLTLRHHVIAVPYRQLVSNWETFITGGEFNVDDSALPTITIKGVVESLFEDLIGNLESTAEEMNVEDMFAELKMQTKYLYQEIGYGTVWDQLFGAYFEAAEDIVNNLPVDPSTQLVISDYWSAEAAKIWNTIMGIFMNQWIGTGSLLDYLGYPVRDWTVLLGDKKALGQLYDFQVISEYSSEHAEEDDLYIAIPKADGLDTTPFSDLPLRAYYRIWYYYFRDQNLDVVGEGYTPEDLKAIEDICDSDNFNWLLRLLMLRPCAWAKDLFNTTTLEAYETNAFVPVTTNSSLSHKPIELSEVKVYNEGSLDTMSVPTSWLSPMSSAVSNIATDLNRVIFKENDAAGLTGFSLRNMKKVESLARWLDKNLFAGWCYADQLSSHFGVRYSDARLQLPEYVGGTKTLVSCQTLTNNTTTTEDVAGSQAAYAQGITANDGCKYFAEEHAIFIDIMSVVPELSYKYSSPKHLMHIKKFDFAFPEFAQLGADMVPYFNVANSLVPNQSGGIQVEKRVNLYPFAYADRYYEYKNNINRLTGKLVQDNPLYTFTQDYDTWLYPDTKAACLLNKPALGPDFIHCVPSVDNFVSDSIEYEFMFDHQADVKASIPLPVVEYV